MYFEKESLQNNIGEDLDRRNRNFEKIETDITLMATNLVKNGDFSNGKTGWGGVFYATYSVLNGVCSLTGDGTQIQPYLYQPVRTTTNAKVYYTARVRVTNSDCQKIYIQHDSVDVAGISLPVANTWYTISGVRSRTNTNDNMTIRSNYPNNATALGKVTEIQYVSTIDLTATFGAGNEPTLAEMDRLMTHFSNSWFDGKQPLNTIRNLYTDKANKVQEAWITPTVLNGNISHIEAPLTYYKDELGTVHVSGSLSTSVSGSIVFTFPVNYRPKKSLTWLGVGYVTASGTMVVTSNGVVPFNIVNFRAEQ